jgi:hypothetical protein
LVIVIVYNSCDGNIEKLVDDQTALVNKIQEIQSLNENNKISNDSLQLELQEVQIQKQLVRNYVKKIIYTIISITIIMM